MGPTSSHTPCSSSLCGFWLNKSEPQFQLSSLKAVRLGIAHKLLASPLCLFCRNAITRVPASPGCSKKEMCPTWIFCLKHGSVVWAHHPTDTCKPSSCTRCTAAKLGRTRSHPMRTLSIKDHGHGPSQCAHCSQGCLDWPPFLLNPSESFLGQFCKNALAASAATKCHNVPQSQGVWTD